MIYLFELHLAQCCFLNENQKLYSWRQLERSLPPTHWLNKKFPILVISSLCTYLFICLSCLLSVHFFSYSSGRPSSEWWIWIGIGAFPHGRGRGIAVQSSGSNFKTLLVKPEVIFMQPWTFRIPIQGATFPSISFHSTCRPSFCIAPLCFQSPSHIYITVLANVGNCAQFPTVCLVPQKTGNH